MVITVSIQNNKKLPFEELLNNLYNESKLKSCSLEDLGFKKSEISQPKVVLNNQIIDDYEETRNFPFLDKTSKIGTALRFGTVSIRKVV